MKGAVYMQEQMREQKSAGKIDILWIVLKTFVGFCNFRILIYILDIPEL